MLCVEQWYVPRPNVKRPFIFSKLDGNILRRFIPLLQEIEDYMTPQTHPNISARVFLNHTREYTPYEMPRMGWIWSANSPLHGPRNIMSVTRVEMIKWSRGSCFLIKKEWVISTTQLCCKVKRSYGKMWRKLARWLALHIAKQTGRLSARLTWWG